MRRMISGFLEKIDVMPNRSPTHTQRTLQSHADPTRIAVVGAGLVGQRHALVIDKLDNAELIGIVDTAEAGKTFATELGVPCFPTLQDLLNRDKPDGVVISTPTTLHIAQGIECVAAKVPALIEKPIGTTSTQSLELVKAADAEKVPLIVGHHRRHNPLIHAAKACIDNGEIGDVRTVHSHCWFYKPDEYFDVAPWRTQAGAGPISVNLVHDVDLIRYLCGEIVQVQAQRAQSIRGFDNEDIATALLTLANGALATITVADSVVSPWSWELTSKEYPIYPQTNESCYRIGGSNGALSIPDLTVWTHQSRPDWWSPIEARSLSFEPLDPLVAQMQHFCRVICGEDEPLVSADEGYRSLRVIEAIQQASLSGERIELN